MAFKNGKNYNIETVDGILPVNKPEGPSSYDIIREFKKTVGIKKIGHAGTLDPFASGVLILCLNHATKLSPFLIEGFKEYEAVMSLGSETDTGDLTGKKISESGDIDIDEGMIVRVFEKFRGEIKQIPPMYSAIKVGGEPLYKLARKGIDVPREARSVYIKELEFLGITDHNKTSFRVVCSKGTYIRSLAVDIGRELNVGAHLYSLCRTVCGPFGIEDCVTLEDIRSPMRLDVVRRSIVPMSDSLKNLKKIKVSNPLSNKVKNGYSLRRTDLDELFFDSFDKGERIRILSENNELIAIARAEVCMKSGHSVYSSSSIDRVLKLERVFH